MTEDKDIEVSPGAEISAEEAQGQPGAAPEEIPGGSPSEVDGAEADGKAASAIESGASVDSDPLAEIDADLSADPDAEDDLKITNEDDVPEEDAEAAMLKMLEDLPAEEPASAAEDINFGSAEVADAEFQHLKQSSSTGDPHNIDLLMDVDLPVSIELGRTKMSIADILGLGPGAVVELNKLAGEPADLLINYKVVARGEVVVIDENFGLRITQLMTPEERLKALADE